MPIPEEDTKLNKFGLPVNSPFAGSIPVVSGNMFDTFNDRSSITGVKLRNFSFNSGTGGTLTLGGANNQNGIMYVKDSTGGTAITLDNSGITVNNGSITIKNAAGSTILDSVGIVSLTNFRADSYILASGTNVISTTPVTLGTLAQFSVSRNTKAFVYCDIYAANKLFVTNPSAGYEVRYTNQFSGTVIIFNAIGFGQVSGTFTNPSQLFTGRVVTLSQGTYNMILQIDVFNGGTVSLNSADMEFGYVLLGA